MDYRRFRNLNESFVAKEASKGMSFAEALDELDFEEVEDIEECAEKPIEEAVEEAAVEKVTNELNETVGFIDCSGSNIGLINTLNNIARKLGVSEYYYFTDHIATSIGELKGYSTNYTDICKYAKANPNKNIVVITDEDVNYCPGGKELTQLANVKIERIENHLGSTPAKENLQEAATSWEAEVAQADSFLDAIVKATGNENYDDGDGYWETEGTTWCNRYLYYGNSLNNTSLVKDLCNLGSSKIPNANFYYTEDDMEDDPVSEIGYTLTKASTNESGYKWAKCKNDLKEDLSLDDYRVVLADYDTDDFDINVELGMQDPDENEVVDYEYLLKPGQTAGDLVVWLSRDCGYTSIYVHDERPATQDDIKRLASDTFSVTGTGDEWQDYGDIVEAADL